MSAITQRAEASNRLPILASEIRQAHADVQEAAQTAAERAIAAGHKLIEARALVEHGAWLPWLREHCALADRTAQLYMQLARRGVKSATVAVLGLKGAAQALQLEYGFHRPLYDGTESERRDWGLFALFLRTQHGLPVWYVQNHIDWIGRHDFLSPDEWLGSEGRAFSWWGKARGEGLLADWRSFRDSRGDLQLKEIENELERLAECDPDPVPASRPKKRRGR
jgi:hypothetical protein